MSNGLFSSAEANRSELLAVRHRIPGRWAILIIAAAVAVVVASSVVAWNGTVPGSEQALLEFFTAGPDALEPIAWVVQQPGVIGAPLIAGLVIVWFTRNWRYFLPFVLILPLKLGIEKGVVKKAVERERPFTSIGPEITVRGHALEGLSFPSGHTTTAFALGIVIAAFLPPRWRLVPIVWAALVGMARLYFGEHNVLDVVAGAAMGTAFAAALWFVFLNRFVRDDNLLGVPG